jgi:hypothetical protein
VLAAAAGYDDPERWWDDLVESRLDSSSPFPMITDAMAELRMIMAQSTGDRNREARREAYMRQKIRDAVKRGWQRVAVVCGAWHAPVLRWPLPPAAADVRTLRGIPRRKITLTWVPWTHQRLAYATGYGAGIASPGWYHHLWQAPDQPIVRWLAKVAQALAGRDLPVSSAHVIEAVRLAETLASLRGRPLAGLAEVTEATRAVLCDGDELAVRYVTDHLVVGQALGSVDQGVPTVPLEADIARTCRTLRSGERRRSVFMILICAGRSIRLVPSCSTACDCSGCAGSCLRKARYRVRARSVRRGSLAGSRSTQSPSSRLLCGNDSGIGSCGAGGHDHRGGIPRGPDRGRGTLPARRPPQALDRLLATLADKAALDADVVHLMDALPALARAQRYGDVRQTDTRAVRKVSEVLVVRICAGLPQAVATLDAANAATMRRRVDAVNTAIGLLPESVRDRWLDALATMIDRTDVHGLLLGRIVRLLLDAERLSDVSVRLQRALSAGVPAADKASWVDGFFSDGALLLIHDAELRQLLDDWVCELDDTQFVDMLPLLRRTFGTFATAERQAIAERISSGGKSPDQQRARSSISSWPPPRWLPSISFWAGVMTEASGMERQARTKRWRMLLGEASADELATSLSREEQRWTLRSASSMTRR